MGDITPIETLAALLVIPIVERALWNVLINKDLFNKMSSFSVGEPNIHSDHNIITYSVTSVLQIQCNTLDTVDDTERDSEPVEYKYVWNRLVLGLY